MFGIGTITSIAFVAAAAYFGRKAYYRIKAHFDKAKEAFINEMEVDATVFERVQDTNLPNANNEEILRLTNDLRAEYSMNPLQRDSYLDEIAEMHMKLLKETQGTVPFIPIENADAPYQKIVGNVSTTKPTVHAAHLGYIVTGKMLDADFSGIGIASEWVGHKLYNVTLFATKKELQD